MGFYSNRALPWFLERVMGLPEVREQRVPSLEHARGRVLEIGFGCGNSLDAYPRGAHGILELVGLEPNPGMLRRAERNVQAIPFAVKLVAGTAERIPAADASFDTVVSHFTLCTIREREAALREVRRVLREDGAFLFLEHGRADEPRLARWQERVAPIQAFFAGGCRPDVPIDRLVQRAGFSIEALVRYEGRPGPRILTQMYRGIARPALREGGGS